MTNAAVPQPGPIRKSLADAISKMWWVLLLRGIALVVLGLYALFMPAVSIAAMTQLLAFLAILDGVLAITAAIMGEVEPRGWMIARGLFCILFGVFVAAYAVPVGLFTAAVLAVVFAIQILASGMMEIMIGIRHRKEIEGEGWLIFGGILSIILGALLVASPMLTALAMVQVMGVFAIVFGGVMVSNAFRARSLSKRLAAR